MIVGCCKSLRIASVVWLASSMLLSMPVQADDYNDSSFHLQIPLKGLLISKPVFSIAQINDGVKEEVVLPRKAIKGTPWLDKVASSINNFQELSDKTNGLNLYSGDGWKAQLKIKNTISHALQDAANNAWDGKVESALKNLHLAFHHVQNNMINSSERRSSLLFIEKYISLLERS